MSRDLNGTADFEQQLRGLLEEGVRRVGGHARSRLNQARHAAVAEAARRGRWSLPLRAASWLRLHLSWMPVGGVMAAAALIAFVLWPHVPQGYPAVEASPTSVEDLDLIADRDGMDIMRSGDAQFYEWAMTQSDQDGPPAGASPGGRSKGRDGQNVAPDTDPNPG
jgi:hypothetical protein